MIPLEALKPVSIYHHLTRIREVGAACDESVEIGQLKSTVDVIRVPVASKNEHGNWLAQSVVLYTGDNYRKPEIHDLSGYLGLFDLGHAATISCLLERKETTKFKCSFELAARPALEGELVGQPISQDLVLLISMFASRQTADLVRDQLADVGLEIQCTGRGVERMQSILGIEFEQHGFILKPKQLKTFAEFQGEAISNRANLRIKHKEDFELSHPSQSQLSAPAIASMDLEFQSTNLLEDDQPAEEPQASIPMKGVNSEDVQIALSQKVDVITKSAFEGSQAQLWGERAPTITADRWRSGY